MRGAVFSFHRHQKPTAQPNQQEMSKEWHAAARHALEQQCRECDIVITTALIPGKPAPRLIHEDMVALLKSGSVVVDLATEAGGNVAGSRPDEVYTTERGVTMVGYTQLPSRLPSTASTLFANNVTKFVLSCGPQTDPKAKGVFRVDHADEAVRGMLITEHGELMWPAPRPAPPGAPAPTAAGEQAKAPQAAEVLPAVEEDPRRAFLRRAAFGTAGAGGLVALGLAGPGDMVGCGVVGWNGDGWTSWSVVDRDPYVHTYVHQHTHTHTHTQAFMHMIDTFALSTFLGYHVVQGVAHALHSPLMSGACARLLV